MWFSQNEYVVYDDGNVPGVRLDCRVAIVDDEDELGFSTYYYVPGDLVWEVGIGSLGGYDAGGYGPGMAVPAGGAGNWSGGAAAGGHWYGSSPYDVDQLPTVVRWTPDIPIAGMYQVHVYIPSTDGGQLSAAAQYDVAFHGGHGVHGLWYGLTGSLVAVSIALTLRFLAVTRRGMARLE